MISKATRAKAKKRLAQAKVKLAKLKAQARKGAARVAKVLKPHQRAMKLAARRYKSALKSS